jgi:allantoate deiminase
MQVAPGAGNVIPGRAEASLDVRHRADSVRHSAVQTILAAGESITSQRNLTMRAELLLDQPAVPCDAHLTQGLRRSVAAAGYPEHTMTSGAGHDAMIVAPHMPAAMLFVRSPGGVSHHPDENVLPEDIAAALQTGLCFFNELERWLAA